MGARILHKPSRQCNCLKSATACCPDNEAITFEVTHPFHPLRGTRWILRNQRQNWGEQRAMYFDAQGRLRGMLLSWTSLGGTDLFAQASAGRSWWRPEDLLHLAALIGDLKRRTRP